MKPGMLSLSSALGILVTIHVTKADKLFSILNSKFFHK